MQYPTTSGGRTAGYRIGRDQSAGSLSARSGRCRGGCRAATQWPSLKPASCPAPARRSTLTLRATRLKLRSACGNVMGKEGRFDVAVTFDERRGYVGTHPDLRAPVVALSLGGLRRKVAALMLPDDVIVMLSLDRAARLERDRRRLTGRPRPGFAGTSA